MIMKTDVFCGVEGAFQGKIDSVLKIHTISLFKSILLKEAEDVEELVEEMADSKYFSFLCDILIYSLTRKNYDITRLINIEDKLDELKTGLKKSAFKIIKNIVQKESLELIDEMVKLCMPHLEGDMDEYHIPEGVDLDDPETYPYDSIYLCYYKDPDEDSSPISLIFKEQKQEEPMYLYPAIFHDELDGQQVILTKPATVLKILLDISQGNHEAALFFLQEF